MRTGDDAAMPHANHPIKRAALFSDVEPEHLAALATIAQPVSLKAGDTLFRQGDDAHRFFFVDTGQIKLFRVSPEGQEKIIELVGPGQTFAEAVMFMGQLCRYPVNAEAIHDSAIYGFEKQGFIRLIREGADLNFSLLRSLSLRLHGLVNQIESLTLQNATYRLVIFLLDHAPADSRPGTAIELDTPKSAIASRLAIQPETLSRLLARLRADGLIEVHGHTITLRDVQGLRHLVYHSA
jgi:CRP-like cAMP-binding protein